MRHILLSAQIVTATSLNISVFLICRSNQTPSPPGPIEINMADPSAYDYPSPLAGYEDAPPLSNEKAADGKAISNPQTGILSKSYERFCEPLDYGIRGAL
jgi:hypothetical protein